jgi:mannitol-1-phosphate 5-dehydrogenase
MSSSRSSRAARELAAGDHRRRQGEGPRAVIVGAGKIGCGLLVPAFADAGWQTALATRTDACARRIAAANGYDVRVGAAERRWVPAPPVVTVGSFGFVDAVAGARLLVVATAAAGRRSLAPALARALAARGREPLSAWVVENGRAAGGLAAGVAEVAVAERLELCPFTAADALVETVVARGGWRPGEHPEFVRDATQRIALDAPAASGPLPPIPGLELVDDFETALYRKLYGFALGHALCAYVGRLVGHRYVHEAATDARVRPLVHGALLVTARAMALERRVTGETPIQALLDRYADATLRDPLTRVARDPWRKLAAEGRLMGPAKLVDSAAPPIPPGLVLGIAAAVHAGAGPGDDVETALERLGAVAELPSRSPLLDRVARVLRWLGGRPVRAAPPGAPS